MSDKKDCCNYLGEHVWSQGQWVHFPQRGTGSRPCDTRRGLNKRLHPKPSPAQPSGEPQKVTTLVKDNGPRIDTRIFPSASSAPAASPSPSAASPAPTGERGAQQWPKVEVVQQWVVRIHYEDGDMKDGFQFDTRLEAETKADSLVEKKLAHHSGAERTGKNPVDGKEQE